MNPMSMIFTEHTVTYSLRWYVAYVNNFEFGDMIIHARGFEEVLQNLKEQLPDAVIVYARMIDEHPTSIYC